MRRVEDRKEIERYLRNNVFLHIYELGDLDPFFWPSTRWYGLGDSELEALCMVYDHPALPTLLALADEPRRPALHQLVSQVVPELPDRFYAHLSPGLRQSIGARRLESRGLHLKMALTTPGVPTSPQASVLGTDELEEVDRFYARAYPGHWFDPRMLESRCYAGVRIDGRLASVAGIHVFSAEQRVAALGNVATDPEFRSRGLAKLTSAAVLHRLEGVTDHVGLNVHSDNLAAIALYEGLGFEVVARYEEVMIT